ncbi:hypothetical protein ACIQM0_19095 [Streptomyces sp. NPDC091387]|uniref:hypothetical protein n=1 Tax=Streptomyces sp. NPDC091387 TaxID=3365998 RepID=UPI0037FF9ADE
MFIDPGLQRGPAHTDAAKLVSRTVLSLIAAPPPDGAAAILEGIDAFVQDQLRPMRRATGGLYLRRLLVTWLMDTTNITTTYLSAPRRSAAARARRGRHRPDRGGLHAAGPGQCPADGRRRTCGLLAPGLEPGGEGGHAMRGFTVGMIGAGAVGQSTAVLLVQERWCTRVMIAARTQESATGLVTDLEDMREITLSSVHAESIPVLRDAHRGRHHRLPPGHLHHHCHE